MNQISVTLTMDTSSWKKLREQKQELLESIEKGILSEDAQGIVHLIDNIQDQAVDSKQVSEAIVFGTHAKYEELAEKIAKGINHGLSNNEIILGMEETPPEDIIGVVRYILENT